MDIAPPSVSLSVTTPEIPQSSQRFGFPRTPALHAVIPASHPSVWSSYLQNLDPTLHFRTAFSSGLVSAASARSFSSGARGPVGNSSNPLGSLQPPMQQSHWQLSASQQQPLQLQQMQQQQHSSSSSASSSSAPLRGLLESDAHVNALVDRAVQQNSFNSGTKSVTLLKSLRGNLRGFKEKVQSIKMSSGGFGDVYCNAELTVYKTIHEELFKNLVRAWIRQGALSISPQRSPLAKRQKSTSAGALLPPSDMASHESPMRASVARRIMSPDLDFPTSPAAARSLSSLPSSPSVGSPFTSEMEAALFHGDDESISPSVSMLDVFAAISQVVFHRFVI